MLNDELKKNIADLAERNGEDFILDKLREEACELVDAIDAYAENEDWGVALHVIEEAADTYIMICQLFAMNGAEWSGEARDFIAFKIKRELCRKAYGNHRWCASNPDPLEILSNLSTPQQVQLLAILENRLNTSKNARGAQDDAG